MVALSMSPAVVDPVALHLDPGNAPATCISAINLGFTSVRMDGSLVADGRTVADYAPVDLEEMRRRYAEREDAAVAGAA